jgi:hypothetical protein
MFSFHLFNETIDSFNIKDYDDSYLLSVFESKIKEFPDSSFKHYIFALRYNADINLFNLLNLSSYMVHSYNNILFDINNLFISNTNIKNNYYNYLNNNFINLSYINLIFKSLNKNEVELSWSKSLSSTFNNNFLFINYDSFNYLLNIFNFLNNNIFENLVFLPKLNNFIIDCNYNKNVIYNIYDLNFIDTFNSLFNNLNYHILKVNGMLNQLNLFKGLLKDIYLEHCDINKNNLKILKELY